MASPFDFSAFLLTPPLPKTAPTPTDNASNNAASTGNNNNVQHSSNSNGSSSMSLDVPGQYGTGQYSGTSGNNYQMSNNQHAASDYQSATQSTSAMGDTGRTDNNQYQQQQQQQQQSGSTGNMAAFDERDYGLDPSAFSSVSFALPSFLSGASNPGQFADGPSIVVDPSA